MRGIPLVFSSWEDVCCEEDLGEGDGDLPLLFLFGEGERSLFEEGSGSGVEESGGEEDRGGVL